MTAQVDGVDKFAPAKRALNSLSKTQMRRHLSSYRISKFQRGDTRSLPLRSRQSTSHSCRVSLASSIIRLLRTSGISETGVMSSIMDIRSNRRGIQRIHLQKSRYMQTSLLHGFCFVYKFRIIEKENEKSIVSYFRIFPRNRNLILHTRKTWIAMSTFGKSNSPRFSIEFPHFVKTTPRVSISRSSRASSKIVREVSARTFPTTSSSVRMSGPSTPIAGSQFPVLSGRPSTKRTRSPFNCLRST
jgi:hypothetical protein